MGLEPDPFPAFLKLASRRVLLVGGGAVATAKLGPLLQARADVVVVAPQVTDSIARAPVRLRLRAFEPGDLDDVWFVVSAAPADVNRQVSAAAEARRLFVNAVDDPASASAYAPAVLRRAGVTVAISTAGRAPALAGLVREGLDALLPGDVEEWTREAARIRGGWRAAGVPMAARRPLLLEALNRLYGGSHE